MKCNELFLLSTYVLFSSAWGNDSDSRNLLTLDQDEGLLRSSITKPKYCQKQATCQLLNYTTCFGAKLTYSSTSLSLVPDMLTQEDAQEMLQRWKGLMHIPKCWAVVQPFLCALFMPKCENGFVDLPSMEMCKVLQWPCRILQIGGQWPSIFNCDNATYKFKCKNDVRELKFKTSGGCKSPLVHAEDESSYYEGIEGCGVQCHDPHFTEDERQEIRSVVFVGSVLAFVFNLFAVLTYVLEWNTGYKYPSIAVFYINFSFLLMSVGYLYQFRPGAKDFTICHKDGTLRTSEPSIRENLSCVTSFVFAYYFLIAGLVWFVIFAYALQLSIQAIGQIKEKMDKRGPYYHLVAWSLPLVLTITVLALGEVDGDSLLGICFVGVLNKQMRAAFVLGPILVSTIGLFFLIKGVSTLIYLRITSKEIISQHDKSKICESIFRVLIFSLFITLFGIIMFICHIYDFQNYRSWKESFRKFIVCQLGVVGDVEVENCRMEHRPSVLMVQLQLIALFGIHITMSTLVWTNSTVQSWSRFFRKIMKKDVEEPISRKKHEIIAKAYAKAKKKMNSINSDNRFSFSYSVCYRDPVGLNFELNSDGSNNFSSTWAKGLPNLITRRGALYDAGSSTSGQWRNSIDSEIISVRRVSVESRRHSLDSTVSVQAVELTKTVRKQPRRHRQKKSHRKDRNFKTRSSRRRSTSLRRSSSSNIDAEMLSVLKVCNFNMQQSSFIPNTSRRSAISNIEMENFSMKPLNVLEISKHLLGQQTNDVLSSSNSADTGKQENSESENDSADSYDENDPLKAVQVS